MRERERVRASEKREERREEKRKNISLTLKINMSHTQVERHKLIFSSPHYSGAAV
jgi:hypothetical protein